MKANRIWHKQKCTAKNHARATVVELLQFQNDLRPLNDFIASVTYVKSTERRSRQRRNRRSICDPPRLCFFKVWRIRKLGQGSSSSPSIALSAGKQSHRVSVLRFFPFGSFWKNRAHKIADISWEKNIFAFLFGGIYCIQPALSRANFFFGKNYSKKLLLCFLPKCPPHGKRCFSYEVHTTVHVIKRHRVSLCFWSIRVRITVHGTSSYEKTRLTRMDSRWIAKCVPGGTALQ